FGALAPAPPARSVSTALYGVARRMCTVVDGERGGLRDRRAANEARGLRHTAWQSVNWRIMYRRSARGGLLLIVCAAWQALAAPLAPVQTIFDGAGLKGVQAVAVTTPDGAHVYAAAHDDDLLVGLARDQTTGELNQLIDSQVVPQVTDVAVTADGTWVYA